MGLLSAFFAPPAYRAATPDNPRFSLNDPAAWDTFLSGEPASSGVRVTRETALTHSPWWRGVNLLSADVAKLHLFVYRSTEGGKTKDTSHPAYRLLRRKANSWQPAFIFKQLLTAHALQTGNGYAWINRLGDGTPIELIPLNPDCTTPVKEQGRLLYVTDINGEKRKLQPEDVFHLKGFGFDGLTGYSVFEKAREDLGLGMASRKYGAIFFRNNARPNIAVVVPGRLDDKQKQAIREEWERMGGGIDNAHRLALLQGGADLKTFTINARDSQLLETRQFNIRDIANWIGVPPHKVGDDTRTSYGSLEQENQEYLETGLDPWLCRWEEESWDKLLTEEQKASESHEVAFDVRRLLRANMTARGGYYRLALGGAPWMTRNEVREQEDLDPVEGGDELLDPLNMGGNQDMPGEDTGKQGNQPPGEDEEKDAEAKANAREVIWWVGQPAVRAAGRPGAFLDWLDTLPRAWLPSARAKLGEGGEKLLCQIQERLLEVSGRCQPAGLAAGVEAEIKALIGEYQ